MNNIFSDVILKGHVVTVYITRAEDSRITACILIPDRKYADAVVGIAQRNPKDVDNPEYAARLALRRALKREYLLGIGPAQARALSHAIRTIIRRTVTRE